MENKKPRTLFLEQTAYQELTRRAAACGGHWAEYFLLLDACSQIISGAPQDIDSIESLDIEAALSAELDRLAALIHRILPGGTIEFALYLSQEGALEEQQRAKFR